MERRGNRYAHLSNCLSFIPLTPQSPSRALIRFPALHHVSRTGLSRLGRRPRPPPRRATVQSTLLTVAPGIRFYDAVQRKLGALRETDQVLIEAPARNCRHIYYGITVRASLPLVWQVLTDYEHLSEFIPNLALSRRCYHPQGGTRLEQEGFQSVLGFRFRASVTLDMTELVDDAQHPRRRSVLFDMVKSSDFTRFQGEWYLEAMQEEAEVARTYLGYCVEVVPRGLIPVQLVEWRIREDLPSNLAAIKRYVERAEARHTTAHFHPHHPEA